MWSLPLNRPWGGTKGLLPSKDPLSSHLSLRSDTLGFYFLCMWVLTWEPQAIQLLCPPFLNVDRAVTWVVLLIQGRALPPEWRDGYIY